MPLVSTGEIVAEAAAARRGCGAFNAIQLEHLTAIVEGAALARSPVIVQLSQNAVRYHGALAPIGGAALATAQAAEARVAVHLDHAESRDLVREAVGLGFGSVMFDASKLDYADNVRETREVVAFCHDHGVWVEAELGEVGGKDGVHAPGARTDPDEAAEFAAATGVDALAVAVGSSHAMLTRDAELDFGLIARLRSRVPVPLVLHGSSGVSDEGLAEAVRAGMTKVNIATQLNKVFTAAAAGDWRTHPERVDPRRYLGAGRDAVTAEVRRLLGVLATPSAARS
ncbi:class II fructose-bisphosphate aldolase [Amycolatopsis sp. SID8362]|uniref:class II fructose-bisphosphate aldolase n=1 Tax=Amycolatopsis sp. SID8362 TaxID=2690346 RepID=UPI001369DD18|nr:class II fructose-bisphosphate aldolase [Amycolatopsis sp. SID8362]NBH03840.1 ketose-bisphosphate aldolase [Amycolatopsis sp. SID8362]NED40540.1 class II fructose-bisphosphate aldolase [Amycolatopsis sp. SID8362]